RHQPDGRRSQRSEVQARPRYPTEYDLAPTGSPLTYPNVTEGIGMNIPFFGTRGDMSSAAMVANRLVAIKETHLRSRMLAYKHVSGELKCSERWLRKLICGQVRQINAQMAGRLDALLVTWLRHEITRHEAELAVARMVGCRPDSDDIFAALKKLEE